MGGLAAARAAFGFLALTAPLCLLVTSCNDDTVSPPPPPDLSTPEAVVEQLQFAYGERDIEAYADLLAPEFQFYFQPIDVAGLGVEYWNADQDSTGTGALFGTNQVSSILIDLTYGPPQVPTEVGFDPDVRKIRLTGVQMEVNLINGTTLLVTDTQDMYFRPGREANGESPDRWYLLEWRDLPPASAPKPQVAPITWGFIKAAFTS